MAPFCQSCKQIFAGAAFEGFKKIILSGRGKKSPLEQSVDEQNADGETDVWRNFDLVHCMFADCLFVSQPINKGKWICSSVALP